MNKKFAPLKKILTGIITIALAFAIVGQPIPRDYKHPRGSNQLGLAKIETRLPGGK